MMVPTAQLIHNTLLAMLITGSHVPPARLHTLKTALHPDQAARLMCQDRDCLLKLSGCMGNRFEVHKAEVGPGGAGGDGGAEVVRYVAPHHKNDRRGSNQVLCYDLPPGPLTHLMLIHIKEGHSLLTRHHRHAQPHLFMSGSGLAFSNALFANWWHGFYHSHKGPLPFFPPSKGRTLFVEHYIASTGHQPQECWEGPALAMGNSVKQWREFYAPRMKGRLAQEAVHQHSVWREGLKSGLASSSAPLDEPAGASHHPPPPPSAEDEEPMLKKVKVEAPPAPPPASAPLTSPLSSCSPPEFGCMPAFKAEQQQGDEGHADAAGWGPPSPASTTRSASEWGDDEEGGDDEEEGEGGECWECRNDGQGAMGGWESDGQEVEITRCVAPTRRMVVDLTCMLSDTESDDDDSR